MATWFSYRNWVDAPGSSLTASAEAGDLLVGNLANRYGYKMWRADELDGVDHTPWFQVDFGQAREVGCLVLLFPRSNLPDSYDVTPAIHPSSDTIRHRLDDTTPGNGDQLDDTVASGVVEGFGYHVYKLSSPVTVRYWRCDLDVPSRGTETFLDVSRAWAGPTIQPAVDINIGATHLWNSDSGISTAARDITDFVDAKPSRRGFVVTFGWLTNAERDEFEDLERLMTSAGQFVICRGDLTEVKGTMFARQQRSTGLQAVSAHLRNQKAFQLVESL